MFKYFNDCIRKSIYNPRDKRQVQEYHIKYMLNRTQSMFKYENLPETINARIIELYLQMHGHLCFANYKDNLYVYTGGLGGEPDVYYMPTVYTIANPAQGISRNLTIDQDCVVMPNDSLYIGLLPLFSKYAYNLAENELSLLLADINSRIITLISASDDRTLESARKYLTDIENGVLGVIAENAFLDGVKSQYVTSGSSNGRILDLIEYEQYLKASWFNEIGLDSNFNMKRERLNTAEVEMNNGSLLPLIDDMLHCRKLAIDKVNQMFGTSITVNFNSAWEDTVEQIEDQVNEDNTEEKGGEENEDKIT